MAFRERVVENNGGLSQPHEMLAINFIFLVEAPYQTGGLQEELGDQTWDSLCDALHDPIQSLSDEVLVEAHQWARRLAQSRPDSFSQLLEDSPPSNRDLKSILVKMADTTQLWNTGARNEDTYLKAQLGPFLDTYFGKLRFTMSAWTPTQAETRGQDSNLLVPDYATTSQVGKHQVSVVLLEGKIAGNRGSSQVWDDMTKLGQEMKLALDTMLLLQPEDEVCVVGILVREPQIEFFSMRLYAEATYIMHRFAVASIIPQAMNAFALAPLMETFAHAWAKVQETVTQLRLVKLHPSSSPKVPLSWIRPSFKKPRSHLVADGH